MKTLNDTVTEVLLGEAESLNENAFGHYPEATVLKMIKKLTKMNVKDIQKVLDYADRGAIKVSSAKYTGNLDLIIKDAIGAVYNAQVEIAADKYNAAQKETMQLSVVYHFDDRSYSFQLNNI